MKLFKRKEFAVRPRKGIKKIRKRKPRRGLHDIKARTRDFKDASWKRFFIKPVRFQLKKNCE